VGPERCIIARYRARAGSWLTVDLDHPLADRRMDVRALDLPDAAFDLALCARVLDTVPDAGRALRELHRVLRPDGVLILYTLPEQDLIAELEAAGFTVEAAFLDEQQETLSRQRFGLDTLPAFVCAR
jgi:SAM-dependent methyltransferase